jgi:hypothetical protein
MAIVLTGTKTVTTAASPQLTAALLTALLATAPELWTVAQLSQLHTAVATISGGGDPGRTIGSLLQ